MNYDVIGDVHGQGEKLDALLAHFGYREKAGALRHPAGRTAVFVGDLIDRGPRQREVLDVVRRMQDAASAVVVMGNHELNAIGYATPAPDCNEYLRPHTEKNLGQHREFLHQVGWQTPLHRECIAWFRSLPVAVDLGGIRICHAWWNDERIAAVTACTNDAGELDEGFLLASFRKDEAAYTLLEGITKGLEAKLPEGHSFTDHAGVVRHEVRVRWWDEDATDFRRAAMVPEGQREGIPDVALPPALPLGNPSPVPVFVGHYWLTGCPARQNGNTAILDYGAGDRGPLVGYRWEGEAELVDEHFVAVGA